MLLTLRKKIRKIGLFLLENFQCTELYPFKNVCVKLLSTSVVVPRNETNGVTGPNEGMRVEPS